jgi:hypothetical protein
VQKDLRGGSTIGGHGTAVIREQDSMYTARWTTLRWDENKQLGPVERHEERHRRRDEDRIRRLTNLNYNSKHLNMFGHYDYFNSTFKNNDLGSSPTATTRPNQRRLQRRQPRSGQGVRRVNLNTSYFTQYNGDWLPLEKAISSEPTGSC